MMGYIMATFSMASGKVMVFMNGITEIDTREIIATIKRKVETTTILTLQITHSSIFLIR